MHFDIQRFNVAFSNYVRQNLQEKLFSLPTESPCAEAVTLQDGSWTRAFFARKAGSVTAVCPVESKVYFGTADVQRLPSANV